jgi:cell division initiation protein
MEVSAKTLREVEFREKMRGYHPEDVDRFLEEVASGVEVLQDRLRQATERAQRAEAAANEAGAADDTLRRTLVLAQRTADMAVQEARDQAARIIANAEQQAQAIIADADERAKRTLDDSLAESRAELSRMEAVRSQAQQDVDGLQRWLDEHKGHLQAALADAMAAVERAGVMWPAPSSRPIDTGASPAAVPRRPVDDTVAISEPDPGPETELWTPTDDEREDLRQPTGQEVDPPTAGTPDELFGEAGVDPEERALDDFFDDSAGFGDDRRFTGRLRRRR